MRFAGGKGKCYQRLINFIPPHETYIESHLGGGAVLRHKRSAVVNIGIDRDPQVIARWNVQYPGLCTLVNADAVAFLRSYPFQGGEFVYADPPYFPETRRRARVYRFDYEASQHEELLEVLLSTQCTVMISGYDNAMYDALLSRWRKETFPAKTHRDVREECVWLNFDPPQQLHDSSYLGGDFRERQAVRRRHSRLLKKFERMSAAERHCIFELLHVRFGMTSRRS